MIAAWAEEEFGGAALGDTRLTARLLAVASTLGRRPSASVPEACGDATATTGAYRFFANHAVDPAAILASHVQTTQQRLAVVPLVLAVQDTTLLDWTPHPATTGLGPLAGRAQQGLVAHSTLAFTPEGVPLGVLAQDVWARDGTTCGQLPDQHQRPLAEKESHTWLTSLAAVSAVRQQCPTTQFVSVGDRAADGYARFIAPRPTGVGLLVRATQDRATATPGGRLQAVVAAAPVTATATVAVPARGDQPPRTATLTVRWSPVTRRPPRHRTAEHLTPVTMWAVLAREEPPPPGAAAIAWLLLTTVAVTSPADALERRAWYARRWGSEVWHTILKRGCRIEARQLQTAARLPCCLTIYSVSAWRILWTTLLARVEPDLPCLLLLEAAEWQALYCHIQQTTILPRTPPSLRQVVRWLASRGGVLGRPGDGDPGPTILWRGFQHLADLTAMYRLFRPTHPRPPAHMCVKG